MRMKAKSAVPSTPTLSRNSSRPLCACGHNPMHGIGNFDGGWIGLLPKTEVAPSQQWLHPYVLNDIVPYLGSPGQGRILADQFKNSVGRNHGDDERRRKKDRQNDAGPARRATLPP